MNTHHYGVYIGGSSTESIAAMRGTIMEILNARVDNKTMRMALKALSDGIKAPEHTSISNCTIMTNPPKEKAKAK